MRRPDINADGWCLDDGETRHRQAPDTFLIPPLELREMLRPGDFAKLIFRIAVGGTADAWERMWVIVRVQVDGGYLGVLDNDPDAIAENDHLWSGSEIPFEPRHIIDAQPGTAASLAVANSEPRRRWF